MEKIIKTAGFAGIAVVILISVFLLPIQANAQLEIKSPDGNSSIKFGLLGQFQAESLTFTTPATPTTPESNGTSKDLYLRRFRILLGGNIMEKLSFFAETDNPGLGKFAKQSDGTEAKGTSDVYLQDAFLTYNQSNEFKIDAGMMLLPLSHNAGQSAASLLGIDYGPYSFLWSAPTASRVGRDYGAQARGYLGNNHFEYRAGVFQGVRGENSTNPFRVMARAVYYPFQNEPGFFYAGSYLGDKKVLGIGMSMDHQDDYNAYGADIFLDYPLANKDVITAQLDYTHYDGGDFIKDIKKQNVIFAEAGYYFQALKIAPFVQLNYDDKAEDPDKKFMQVGLAYYIKGQNLNVKLGIGQYSVDGGEDQTQVLLRIQAFMF
jgi:hypothetical protein